MFHFILFSHRPCCCCCLYYFIYILISNKILPCECTSLLIIHNNDIKSLCDYKDTKLAMCQSHKIWHAVQNEIVYTSLLNRTSHKMQGNHDECLNTCFNKSTCMAVETTANNSHLCNLVDEDPYVESAVPTYSVLTYIMKCCQLRRIVYDRENLPDKNITTLLAMYKPEDYCVKESLEVKNRFQCKYQAWKVSSEKKFIDGNYAVDNTTVLQLPKGKDVSDCLKMCINHENCTLVTVHTANDNICQLHFANLSSAVLMEDGWLSYEPICCTFKICKQQQQNSTKNPEEKRKVKFPVRYILAIVGFVFGIVCCICIIFGIFYYYKMNSSRKIASQDKPRRNYSDCDN